MITVVGAGLAGLVASVEIAERGGTALVFERSAHLGGRARTTGKDFRVNFGGHALYSDGPTWSWLETRGLLPPTRRLTNPLAVRFVWNGRARRTPPPPVRRAARLASRTASAETTYRDWIATDGPDEMSDAVCRVGCFYSFSHDPGMLSARFVNERNARLVRPPSPSRFVSYGGWQRIVDALAQRALRLGVEIRLSERLTELPDGPVIVATELHAASELLGEPLEAPRPDAVLLDVGIEHRRRDPTSVIDVDGGAFIERYSAFDSGLAPQGQELLQCHIGRRPDEAVDDAVARIETALDVTFGGWRDREMWRAVRRSNGRTGAVELPHQLWTSRPAVDRGGGRFLAGDAVRAPGLLSEVAVNSAVEAAGAAIAASDRPNAST